MFNMEDDEQEQADVDAMDQDLTPSDLDSVDIDIDDEEGPIQITTSSSGREIIDVDELDTISQGAEGAADSFAEGSMSRLRSSNRHIRDGRRGASAGSSTFVPPAFSHRTLPTNDETPTKPRIRNTRRR